MSLENWLQLVGILAVIFIPLAAYIFKQDKNLDALKIRLAVTESSLSSLELRQNTEKNQFQTMFDDFSKEVRAEYIELGKQIYELQTTLHAFIQATKEHRIEQKEKVEDLQQEIKTVGKDG